MKEKELGKEYVEELKEVLKIRKNRRAIYGDSFLKDKAENLLVLIEGKINRYKVTDDFETKLDSLRDSVNYLIFLLCVIKNDKNLNS